MVEADKYSSKKDKMNSVYWHELTIAIANFENQKRCIEIALRSLKLEQKDMATKGFREMNE